MKRIAVFLVDGSGGYGPIHPFFVGVFVLVPVPVLDSHMLLWTSEVYCLPSGRVYRTLGLEQRLDHDRMTMAMETVQCSVDVLTDNLGVMADGVA